MDESPRQTVAANGRGDRRMDSELSDFGKFSLKKFKAQLKSRMEDHLGSKNRSR
jgi:hypothetical protein